MLKKIKSTTNGGFNGRSRIKLTSLTLLETFVITICLFIIIFAIIVGLLNQTRVNNDKIRIRHMVSIKKALDSFYNDSSSIEFARAFPISECSTSTSNSIDYENTLNLILSGQINNSFKYIEPNSYPQDLKAEYVSASPKACNDSKNIKQNNSCNHNPQNGKNFCYLYSTSPSGDRFTLSFFSESKNRQVTLTQIRNDKLQTDNVDLTQEIIY